MYKSKPKSILLGQKRTKVLVSRLRFGGLKNVSLLFLESQTFRKFKGTSHDQLGLPSQCKGGT